MSKKVLWSVILVQVALAMLGSLYFSNFGDPLQGLFSGTGFEPCHLCWWGRILMYPMLIVALYALIKKDHGVSAITASLSGAGVVLAAYHCLIQYKSSLNVFSCAAGNDCSAIGWHIGFVTIPVLELLAFLLIFVVSLMILLRKKD